MFKKIVLVFVLATGIFSCFCDDVAPFWGVRDFNIHFLNSEGNWVSSDTLTTDEIDLIVEFDLDYFTEVSFKDLFINSAMATSCPNDGDEGMKDPISKITLTCTEEYNNFAAGSSLNSIVEYADTIGFNDFITSIESFPAVSFLSFKVIEKPTNLDSLKFNLQFDFDSGNSLNKESEYIYWQ